MKNDKKHRSFTIYGILCSLMDGYICLFTHDCLFVCYAIFLQIEREGSVFLAYILVCLVGLSGVALGKMQ